YGTSSKFNSFKEGFYASEQVILGAARRGDLALLKSLKPLSEQKSGVTIKAVTEAGRRGHLDIVLWICQQFPYHTYAMRGACQGAQWKVIDAIRDNFNPIPSHVWLNELAQKGHLRLLKYILQAWGVYDITENDWSRAADIAAQAGHFRFTRFILQAGFSVQIHVHRSLYIQNSSRFRRILQLPKVKFLWDEPLRLMKHLF